MEAGAMSQCRHSRRERGMSSPGCTDTQGRALVVGTAGHIDHGKSTLVEALTGTDPDRLAAEKERGITIELGFAKLELGDGTALGVVDVPGHERFVRQMIAGASGIDLALMCIAADDGVMPQTREHFAVLELLGVTECVIALTKTDLVDAEWRELVTAEIRGEIADTPYADSTIVAVSARSGEGLEELRGALAKAAQRRREEKLEVADAPMRLPIDRVFTIKGTGTVVTGTLWSGTVGAGDELEALPSGRRSRVRSVQVHGEPVERSVAGNRTAVALADLGKDEVRRGEMLVEPESLACSERFDARFTYLPAIGPGEPLESGARVHIAHGTREVCGRVLFMDGKKSIAAGESAYAQVRLDEALPLAHADRFVARSLSPVRVIGGGEVLDTHPRRRTTLGEADTALLDALAADDERAMVAAAIRAAGRPVSPGEVAATCGLSEERVREIAESGGAAGGSGVAGAGGAAGDSGAAGSGCEVLCSGGETWYATSEVAGGLVLTIENALLAFHAEEPTATGITPGALRNRMPRHLDEGCFEALLERTVSAGKAQVEGGEVSHPSAGAAARELEEQTARTLLALTEGYGAAPPAMAELFAEAGVDARRGSRAVLALEREGLARRVGDFCFATGSIEELWEAASDWLDGHGEGTAAELKEAMGTSRKYAIPLLEHFDARGLTKRDGDVRRKMQR